jgi:hypothetical protein
MNDGVSRFATALQRLVSKMSLSNVSATRGKGDLLEITVASFTAKASDGSPFRFRSGLARRDGRMKG